jgi:hypothetical protein
MKKGFVLSIDIMIAMTLFVGIIHSVQLRSQISQNLKRDIFLKESAFITAHDCLLISESALLSKNTSLINMTLSNCTRHRTNILIKYYDKQGDESVLEVQNFEGTESISARRLLTSTKGSSVTEFIIAILEVEQ